MSAREEGSMPADRPLGIDLGTSNSCVAVVVDGELCVLANERGERTTPSVVHVDAEEGVTVGSVPKARVVLDPRHTVSSAKRLIGRYFFSEEVRKATVIASYDIVEGPKHSVRIPIRGHEYTLPEISAFVLKEMKEIATRSLGQPVSRAVITVPAYFNDNQRQATKDAGRIAGLEVLRILNEPTAAALAYGYGRDLNQRVAVYDFGGGTFDVSILDIGKDVYEVLSTCGDTFLGGDDFDDRIIDVVADYFQAEHGINIRRDPVGFEKVKAAAEQAKIELSENDKVTICVPDLVTVDNAPVGLTYELFRTDFEKLVMDLMQRTFKVCDEALQQANITARDLDGVILVGGPTRLPTIRNAVREYFQREPETGINPDEVVAIGAAIHAQSLAGGGADTFLLDVTPLSLRLGIAGGMTETIIERNTPVPIEQSRMFTTVRDDQEAVAVKIYQGERRSAQGNELLGEFEFSGFELGPRGGVQIEVTFAISTEGIVKVSARDPKTGSERSTTVKMSGGLSDKEIRTIIEEAEAQRPQRARAPEAPQPARPGTPRREPPALPSPGDADDDDHSFGNTPPLEAPEGAVDLPGSDDEDLLLDDEDGESAGSGFTEEQEDLFGRIDGSLTPEEDEEPDF
jgi:molecular chaperone DnaK